MREIAKGPEPPSLTAHRNSFGDYRNYNDKDTLRRALVREQRGLCCYCMARVHDQDTKIEHWRPQSRFPEQQLVYRNLLAACPGRLGEGKSQKHCDTRKGSKTLSLNPADPSHQIEAKIRYRLDGSIWSNEAPFNAELDDVLKLNLPILMQHRKGVLDSIAKWYEKVRLRRSVTRSRLQRERQRWLPADGELAPYCQVVVWWLDQRLARIGE